MANKYATIFQADHIKRLNATITPTSVLGGYSFDAIKVRHLTNAIASNYFSANTSLPFTIHFNFGQAVTIDTWVISTLMRSGGLYDSCIRNGSIQYSTDNTVWNTAHTFTDLFGGTTPSNSICKKATLSFTTQTARYWRIVVTGNYGGGTYSVGGSIMLAYNSADIGAEILSSATLTTLSFISVSLPVLTDTTLSDITQVNIGLQSTAPVATTKIDFGSLRYVGGFDIVAYNTGNDYNPGLVDVLTSTTGNYDDWTYRETIDVFGDYPNNNGQIFSFIFSRIYKTRHMRFVFKGEGSTNPTVAIISYHMGINQTLTPSAPPTPTALTVLADVNDVSLYWSQAAGDDNAIGDIIFDVERSVNGGAFATVATGLVNTSFYESAPNGDVEYRVKARNKYHEVESAYATLPVVEIPFFAVASEVVHASSS